jgi:hypothetical protein
LAAELLELSPVVEVVADVHESPNSVESAESEVVHAKVELAAEVTSFRVFPSLAVVVEAAYFAASKRPVSAVEDLPVELAATGPHCSLAMAMAYAVLVVAQLVVPLPP